MDIETPRDADGEPLCEWCGAEVKQPPTGRRRLYCSRTHREYAYRQRRERRLTARAYAMGKADAESWSVSTTGESVSTTGVTVPSVDETLSPAPIPPPQRQGRRAPSPGRVVAEECPYCRASVFGLMDHLPVCPEGPGTEEQPDGEGPPSSA
jgi:hypothetical protein